MKGIHIIESFSSSVFVVAVFNFVLIFLLIEQIKKEQIISFLLFK